MGKSSKSKRRRDNFSIANRRLPALYVVRPISQSQFLSQFEDRRRWHPEGRYAPAVSFSNTRHRLRVVEPTPRAQVQVPRGRFSRMPLRQSVPVRVGFQAPDRVLICVRRQRRKEVLFAKNKTGRVGQKTPRFNFYSSVSCRR